LKIFILLLPVTIKTEFHVEVMSRCNERHVFDVSVATHTAHPILYMLGVIKVDVIREIIHALPGQRFLIEVRTADWAQIIRFLKDVPVTAVARFHRRDVCEIVSIGLCVTVLTIKSQISGMCRVRKGDRLGFVVPAFGNVRGVRKNDRKTDTRENKHENDEDDLL
jgi:hypothetical protein